MSVADAGTFARDLHTMLRELDPARWPGEAEARRHFEEVETRLEGLMSQTWSQHPAVLLRLNEIDGLLHAAQPEGEDAWVKLGKDLRQPYERLANALRAEDIHVPSLRPTNYARNILHVGGALTALALILSPLPMLPLAAAMTAFAWTLETTRRWFPAWNDILMTILGRVAHPHEAARVNSSTWYSTALLGLALTGEEALAAVAVAVLGLGDPMAALVGRRFGRTKLVNGRTLEGSLAFVLAGTLAAALVIRLAHPEVPLAAAPLAALFGAVAELFSRRVDDNLSVPLAAAAGAALLL